jgi:hypothetical protein
MDHAMIEQDSKVCVQRAEMVDPDGGAPTRIKRQAPACEEYSVIADLFRLGEQDDEHFPVQLKHARPLSRGRHGLLRHKESWLGPRDHHNQTSHDVILDGLRWFVVG